MTYELLANRATGGLIGGYRDVWTRWRKWIVGQMVKSFFCAMSTLWH